MSFVPHACPGPMTRRRFMEVGALGVGGLGLSDLYRLRAQAAERGAVEQDTAVIFVWLPGGPPHQETYDMKPEAPSDYRGIFHPIPTNVRGIDVCEHLPLHAKVADKYSLIRSVAHTFADHGGGHKRFMTGRDPLQPVDFVNDYPAVPSMATKCRERRNVGVPNYVNIVDGGREGIDVFSFGSAYLGPETHPFAVVGDPSAEKFEIKNLSLAPEMAGKLDDRQRLLSGLDNLRRAVDRNGTMSAIDEFNRRALDLLTGTKARNAFDIAQEPAAIRDRYGRHAWGQRAIMARRLVEAGVSWVTVVMENPSPSKPMPKYCVYNWDSHAVNCHLFDDFLFRAPFYDQAITALIEDIYARGLDKKVLLVVTGEFGRTPRISTSIGTQTGVMQPGRDHWPQAMSILISGGGLKTGVVVGSTNAKAEHPKDRPLAPNDLWATVFRHLGIDPHDTSFPDHRGRPMPILPYGQAISELT